MSDFPEKLSAFLAQSEEPDFNLLRKVDLLTRVVSNLIDEVVILRRFIQQTERISAQQWQEYYRNEKMKLLFSSSGIAPPPLSKYEAFFRDEDETAEALIPKREERERWINELTTLT